MGLSVMIPIVKFVFRSTENSALLAQKKNQSW